MDPENTVEIVQKILHNVQTESLYKSTDVHKDIDVESDLGNLLIVDPNPVDLTELRSNRNEYLMSFARDDVQLLVNDLWKLPVEVVENVHVVKLPAPKTVIPREKPVPAPKKPTRWEEYARLKGINKRKRGRMVWDETAKEWKPRWGYKRANDDTKDWLIEVPNQADPFEDQFAKRLKAKKEKIAKNELQRLRNIARNMKGKVPGVGLTPVDKPDKDHVSRSLAQAHASTASLGKFNEKIAKEKPLKQGKKRKFEPNLEDLGKEKKRSLEILKKLNSDQPLVDADKMANRLMAAEQTKRAESKQTADEAGKKKRSRRSKSSQGGTKNHKNQKDKRRTSTKVTKKSGRKGKRR